MRDGGHKELLDRDFYSALEQLYEHIIVLEHLHWNANSGPDGAEEDPEE